MVNLYRYILLNDFNKANTKIESDRIDYNVIVIYIEASNIKKEEGKNSKNLTEYSPMANRALRWEEVPKQRMLPSTIIPIRVQSASHS